MNTGRAPSLVVGTSGWQYRSWRGPFYPAGLPSRRWLEYYSRSFAAVELNASFYGLPSEASVRRWADETPEDFRFAVKASRYLTHVRRLRDPAEPMQLFLERLRGLGPRLGPILVQLPPDLEVDTALLDATLSACPPGTHIALEPRHPSWFVDEVRAVLSDHGAALCAADRRSQLRSPLWRTADWGYVRLHEGTAHPSPCYGHAALRAWVDRIADTWRPTDVVYVFFNNDDKACAPLNALSLERVATRRGLHPEPR